MAAQVLFNNIKPGSRAVCVDVSDDRHCYINCFLTEHKEYEIQEIIGENGVKLVGVPGIWRAMRFDFGQTE